VNRFGRPMIRISQLSSREHLASSQRSSDSWHLKAAGLTWPQVRLSRCEVLLTKTKTDRPRVIRIGVETVKLLSALPRHLNSKMVFRHGDGERYCNVASRFREIVKSAQKAAQTKGRDFTHFGAMTSDIAMRSANWKRGVTYTI